MINCHLHFWQGLFTCCCSNNRCGLKNRAAANWNGTHNLLIGSQALDDWAVPLPDCRSLFFAQCSAPKLLVTMWLQRVCGSVSVSEEWAFSRPCAYCGTLTKMGLRDQLTLLPFFSEIFFFLTLNEPAFSAHVLWSQTTTSERGGGGGGQGAELNPTLTAYQPNALPLGQSSSLMDAWTDVELMLGRARSKHCFPAPSSKPCQNGFSHWRGTLSPSNCPPMPSAPSKRFGY